MRVITDRSGRKLHELYRNAVSNGRSTCGTWILVRDCARLSSALEREAAKNIRSLQAVGGLAGQVADQIARVYEGEPRPGLGLLAVEQIRRLTALHGLTVSISVEIGPDPWTVSARPTRDAVHAAPVHVHGATLVEALDNLIREVEKP